MATTGSNAVKWFDLLQRLRAQHANDQFKAASLHRYRAAEDIVMGWSGLELYQVPPGAVLTDSHQQTTQQKIWWLWGFVDVSKAMDHAAQCSKSSTLVVADALNWLIEQGVVWPDGSVSKWAADWRVLESNYQAARKLRVVYQAEQWKPVPPQQGSQP